MLMKRTASITTRIQQRITRPAAILSLMVGSMAVPALVCGPLVAQANAAPSPTALLLGMVRADATQSYSATEVIERVGSPTLKMRVWRQGHKQRVEYQEPPIRQGDLVVNNGQSVWIYLRGENIRRMRSSDAKVSGVGTVGKRTAWIVEIKQNGALWRRLWIDQKNNIALRSERMANDRRVESSVLQNIVFSPVDASHFNWTAPKGAQVTRTAGSLFTNATAAQRTATWLRLPSSLPAGYAFESAVVDGTKGEAWLRYSSGSDRFSIFQQKSDDGVKPLQKVNDAWFLQRGGNRFLIVGLNDADAGRVSNSLK
jgi:outer membrane lipoprotein-sorting protein